MTPSIALQRGCFGVMMWLFCLCHPSVFFPTGKLIQGKKTSDVCEQIEISKLSKNTTNPWVLKPGICQRLKLVEEEIQRDGEIQHCDLPNPCSYCHNKDNNNLINVSLAMQTLLCGLKKRCKKPALTHWYWRSLISEKMYWGTLSFFLLQLSVSWHFKKACLVPAFVFVVESFLYLELSMNQQVYYKRKDLALLCQSNPSISICLLLKKEQLIILGFGQSINPDVNTLKWLAIITETQQ